MPKKLEFKGTAKTLTDADIETVAARLQCDTASVRAVAAVESGGKGGFLNDKRPRILFESRWFHKLTNGAYDESHPDVSTPRWVRNYRGGAGEYRRLQKAIALDRPAALKSASWGMFQVLGVNHGLAGFDTVESYVKAQLASEGAHLRAFAEFVVANHLDDELRDRRWADFAYGYNGPRYAENHYDTKLQLAYAKFAGGWYTPSALDVQRALNEHGASLVLDGITGPATRQAIREFQRDTGLAIDGVAGPMTLAALGLSETHDPLAVA